MDYKISIIIPVYNVEDYLSNTLESIVSQSIGIENLEVILVDDKSTDGSAKVIKEYVEKYENFKGIFFGEGSGFPGKPRNVGLKFVNSDFIMFLDSDDFLEEDACEILYNVIREENADLVSGSFTRKNKEGVDEFNYGAWVSTLTDLSENYSTRLNKTKEILSDPNFKLIVTNIEDYGTVLGNANVWGKIFRTDFIKDNNLLFPEDIVAQDSVFLLESLFNASKIVFIKDVIVRYNNRRSDAGDKSISYVKSNNNLFGRIKAYGLMHDLSKRFGHEKLFYRYLLGHKLSYWFNSHLMDTYISTFEIEFIFRKYFELFKQCYLNNEKLSSKMKMVLKDISEEKFHIAAQKASKFQKPFFKNQYSDVDVSVVLSLEGSVESPLKCLNQVMNQSLNNIEIICIDDKSCEENSKLLNEYKLADNRIRIISKEDSEDVNLKNYSINIAQGEFILFLDPNMWLEKDALEKLKNNATSNDSEFVLFDTAVHENGNVLKSRSCLPFDSEEDYNNFSFIHLFNRDFIFNNYSLGTKFYRTSFLLNNEIHFNDYLYFDDIQFNIQSSLLAKKISYSPEFLCNYSEGSQSSVQKDFCSTEKSFAIFEVLENIEVFLQENNLFEEYEIDFLKFKISQLSSRLSSVANHCKVELYNLIQEEFNSIEISSEKLKQLPFNEYKFYIDVLTYDSFFEFIYYQDVEFNNDNYEYENILNRQNELIINLNDELTSLTNDNLILNKFSKDILNNSFFEAINKINELNLFDEEFYRNTYGYDGNLNPLIHYIYEGYKHGWNPCERFDTLFYTSVNDNLKESGMNPLIYFVSNGLDEGIIRINSDINQLKSINKNNFAVKFNNFNKLGVKTIKRKQKVIISLTSTPENIHDSHYCIYSLLNQKFYPDEVILWLAEEQFPNKYADLPKELLKLLNNGLTINWCHDIKSYKKLVPSLADYPNDIIITVEDNIYYPDFWLSNLMEEHYRNPNSILCYQSKRMAVDKNNKLSNYADWEFCKNNQSPSYLNFFMGRAGILYPPNSFNIDVLNEDLFMKICPFSEDLWFWAMAVLNYTKIKVIGDKMNDLKYIDPLREINLFNDNKSYTNDVQIDNQIKKLLKHFPELMKILFNELDNHV